MERSKVLLDGLIVTLFVLSVLILVGETRSIWAKPVLLHQGVLRSYTSFKGLRYFEFADNTTIVEKGWMWKTFVVKGREVAVYKKGRAIVVEETGTGPAIQQKRG